MASTYLTRALGTPTNRNKWTFSGWVKRGTMGANQAIFQGFSSGTHYTTIQLTASDTLEFGNREGSHVGRKITTRVFRDPAAWMHICCVFDSDNATADDRMKIYINGVRETEFGTSTNPSSGENSALADGYNSRVGVHNTDGYFWTGLMTHLNFVDGSALAPTVFGETDSTSGIWKIKTSPSVTYGDNGFFLKMETTSGSGMGTDSSGEGNNLTTSGSPTQALDNPSNNFCTINSIDNYWTDFAIANGNTKCTTHISYENFINSTYWLGAGRWYWEVLVDTVGNGADVGFEDRSAQATSDYLGKASGCAWRWDGNLRVNNSYATGTFATFTTGDYLGFYLDLEDNKIYIAKNGTILNSGTGVAITPPASVESGSGLYSPGFGDEGNQSSYSANFGNGTFASTKLTGTTYEDANTYGMFKYSPNDGGAASFDSSAKNFYAICTKNIKAYGG